MATKYQLYIYLSKNRDDPEWVQRYKQKVRDHNQKIIAQTRTATYAPADSGFDLFMPIDGADYGYGVENLLSRQLITNPGITSSEGVDGARGLNLGVRACMRISPLVSLASTTTATSAATSATSASASASASAPLAPQTVTTTTSTITPFVTATDLPTPTGFYLYPRSSISKTRMRLANSVGIIDAGYRGDLIAAVDTIGLFGSTDIWHIWKETLSPIKKYDRYFQVCAPDLSPFLVHIVDTEEELSPPTARGHGGFGSTGV
jgi:dUTP pyrophosphatase